MKRPKPKPDSLPMPTKKPDAHVDEETGTGASTAPDQPPPWAGEAARRLRWHQDHTVAPPQSDQPKPKVTVSKLQAARRKADQLGEVLRDEAFDDWVRCCLVEAARPDEWSQSRTLYESYLRHVARYGSSRKARGLSRQVAATETRFGKMMGSVFPKVRRARGWFYSVRPKRGA